MCLSKAYIDKDGKRELLMDEVAALEIEEDKLILKTLFGEKKEIAARIREIDFVANNIVLSNSRN